MPPGAGFQGQQASIALGSGGIFGVGIGESVQKAFYLPEAHTDMIAAVIGEELGLIGISLLVGPTWCSATPDSGPPRRRRIATVACSPPG